MYFHSIAGLKLLSDWGGWFIFCTIFHEVSKKYNFHLIWHTQYNFCWACLLSFDELGRACASTGYVQSWKNHIFGILMTCFKTLTITWCITLCFEVWFWLFYLHSLRQSPRKIFLLFHLPLPITEGWENKSKNFLPALYTSLTL